MDIRATYIEKIRSRFSLSVCREINCIIHIAISKFVVFLTGNGRKAGEVGEQTGKLDVISVKEILFPIFVGFLSSFKY